MRRLPGSSGLLRRVAAGTGVEEVLVLERRIDDLAEAVAENAALEAPLTAIVAELEQSLVGPLEHRLRQLGAR
ncbi:hypothetical protein [Nocardioides marmotae]|uniref:Uncharacterized protein n=1 Tax=Nocardioides marmotae TaxID=2663857 RepID=A0A6I3J6G0_9ACTN|nr:hypothetical protein [Nocardioides marmotae]MCR6031475.1 hypothetical protein [Gordonia jinghuaiqii]MBC9733369.1 hypothetical protein [Nocardioides marmotae]MTB84476.1 hypothetical protein [Nocardioides marmotae]MTB95114.1 hypothetical protein [Nocardioides marmotae]QKE02398.1 hypothetical protein HPC71_15970 [Nocardioides marmotae]